MAFDRIRKIVLTGASGNLGRFLAGELVKNYGNVVLTDLVDYPGTPPAGATFIRADVADANAVMSICEEAAVILHFGGISTEKTFETILPANIVGVVNIFEAARKNGARVVFASSNHTIGFHERGRTLDTDMPTRPDSFYGISKIFGENMGSVYFDKHGVESVHIRIGSALPEPLDERHLSTWLSLPDLFSMIVRSIEAERTGFAILWGASANTRTWWRNDDSERLGIVRADNSEIFADKVSGPTNDPITEKFQGGIFCGMDTVIR